MIAEVEDIVAGGPTPFAAAWIGLVGALIGGFVSSLTSFLLWQKERRERRQIAILDRQIVAYSEAYALILDLLTYAASTGESIAPATAYTWHRKNGLLLSRQLRQDFHTAINRAVSHRSYLELHVASASVETNWAFIERVRDRIASDFDSLIPRETS